MKDTNIIYLLIFIVSFFLGAITVDYLNKPIPTEFLFSSRIEVIKGFYKGQTGTIVNNLYHKAECLEQRFEIRLERTDLGYIYTDVCKEDMRLIK